MDWFLRFLLRTDVVAPASRSGLSVVHRGQCAENARLEEIGPVFLQKYDAEKEPPATLVDDRGRR